MSTCLTCGINAYRLCKKNDVMAARRPAKLASAKKVAFSKLCPACTAKGKESNMSVIKMVRHSKPSGMFWVCNACSTEVPTRGQ